MRPRREVAVKERLMSVVMGHRKFGLGTGQAIPVLVKAEVIRGTAPEITGPPDTTPSTCPAPPTTSTL